MKDVKKVVYSYNRYKFPRLLIACSRLNFKLESVEKSFVLSLQTCLSFVQDFFLHTLVSLLDGWDYKPNILHPENLPADLLTWQDQLASFEEKEAVVPSEV